jgi:hypothetical protein
LFREAQSRNSVAQEKCLFILSAGDFDLCATAVLGIFSFMIEAAENVDACDRAAEKRVLIVTPGGTRACGGIGRLVASLTRRFATEPSLRFEVIDTYGPRVNSAIGKIWMPLYFAAAVRGLLGPLRLGLAAVRARRGKVIGPASFFGFSPRSVSGQAPRERG